MKFLTSLVFVLCKPYPIIIPFTKNLIIKFL
nr:MAG TPA: hypothetical protein [Caudoviricetes sp.]